MSLATKMLFFTAACQFNSSIYSPLRKCDQSSNVVDSLFGESLMTSLLALHAN